MGAYGRHFFGFTYTVLVDPMVGHAGEAPFLNVLDNLGASSPHVTPTVFGVLPRDMPTQALCPGTADRDQLGQKGGGAMYWELNLSTNKFELAPFTIVEIGRAHA